LQILCDGIPFPSMHLHVDSSDQCLPQTWAYALFRCVQEAITNAMRHSGATDMWIRLSLVDCQPQLVIHDNGRCRFPLTLGNGLRGIQERVETLGGSLQMNPESGKSLCLQINLPRLR
jgi:signal transduction histidine kinase